MNTKKIIAVTLSTIICSAVITPVASADTEEQIQKHINAAKNHEKKKANYKPVIYNCTKVFAKDEKGIYHGPGGKESNNKIIREMAKKNGWKIEESKGKCIK
ncbi:TPA: hypothetical protein U0R95_003605 [Escherichia coli]|nr:hypothetical protein [Escherichia coli]HEL8057629.1 hypothetical protein [Escherichia coli]HEL8100758.1 hypothetical protein [Escherichia coli]HEL8735024.1 hypothetical protein [Escherichia coli]HEM0001271.1 hypothetical protein [Escherichia coli]